MECPYCHKEIPQDSAFCYHCGKELNGEKKGYAPTGNKNYAYISIFLSIFVALVNISQIILK